MWVKKKDLCYMLKLYLTYISIYICVLISITYVKMELARQCYSNFLFDFSLCWLGIYLESAKDFKSLNLFFFFIRQINSLHFILYYIYQPSLLFSSFLLIQSIRYPASSLVQMPSQLCFSNFVSKLLNLSCPSDMITTVLIRSGHSQ